jgi:3-oxoacyl-[acyl-carrier-protein] synthase II
MNGGRRVVVTGIGMVTPLGHTAAATAAALDAGASAVADAALFDPRRFGEPRAAEIRDFDPRPHFRVTKALKLTDRRTRFAVAAASMAAADARWPDAEGDQLGVLIGASAGDLQVADVAAAFGRGAGVLAATDIGVFAERMLDGLNPLWLLVSLPNMCSAHVAIQLGARGPNSTVMTDWAAGLQAIGEASDWIRTGEAEAVVAGGADSALHPLAYAAFEQAGLFGACGGGRAFVPGEGAAVLLLEEREHAMRRGAPVRAEVAAYATFGPAADAAGDSALARSMAAALGEARWPPGRLRRAAFASVFADRHLLVENDAALRVFGADIDRVERREHTSRLGHALGASGAIEAALLVAGADRGDCGMLCSAVAYSGQAVAVAFDGPDRAARSEEGRAA